MIDRKITVVVAEQEIGGAIDDDYGNSGYSDITHDQTSYNMRDLLIQAWFIQYLKDNGFYCKDEQPSEGVTHLDSFIYQYGTNNFKYYTTNLTDLKSYNCESLRVYQEVVGAERLHGVSTLIKARDKYIKKQAEIAAKEIEKESAKREKRRLLAVEKAKALLIEEGVLRENS